MSETANELLRRCVSARGEGIDFPTIWQTILRGHPLVVGPPVQRMDGSEPILEIRLISGQRLVHDSHGFALR